MTRFIESWASLVLATRGLLIGAAVVIILLILATGGIIPTDNSSERYFVEGDPALRDYDSLIEQFGDNEYLVVGLQASAGVSDVFHPDTLGALQLISDFLESHRHVTQLRSLANYEYISADGDDLRSDYLIEDMAQLGSDAAALAAVKSRLEQETLALDSLITRDYRHTRIVARLEHRDDTSEHKVELVRELYDFLAGQSLAADSYSLHLSGYVLAQERLETLAAEDSARLIPFMVLLMLLILFFSFRSALAMLLPWLVIAGGLLMVLEFQYYLGYSHTTIDSSALAPTLIIIGIGLTVHVLVEFFHSMQAGGDSSDAVRSTIVNIWRPAFFTAITTAAGFYSLSITRLAPIREFALLGAIGALLLFLFSMTVLPACLSYIRTVPERTQRVLHTGAITLVTRKVPDFTLRHRKLILALGAATLLFSVWNIPNINVDTNYVTIFREDSVTRRDIDYFDATFRGMMTLDIIVDSGADDGIREPDFLAAMDEVQAWLEQRDSLGPINSLVDYLKEINMALNGDDPAYFRVPDSRELAAQLLLLYDSSGANEDLSDIRDFNQRYTRLIVPVINMPALAMRQELDTINAWLDTHLAGYDTTVTGTMVLKTQQDIYVVEGIARSFIIALSVITVFFIVLFRSFKYGLLSIIPSVLPIVFAGSLAGWLGIDLDLSAVIVFALTMGIAVDDAIHVMSRYLLAKNSGASTRLAIQRALHEAGRAVVFSSLVLVCGFSILALGSITTFIYVGLFGAVIMTLALLGDLLVLPAILYLADGTEEESGEASPVEA